MCRKYLVVAILFSAIIFDGYAQVLDWKLKYNRDNIKVYYRKAGSGNVYELRLTTTVNASLSSIAALLNDVDSYTHWVFKTVKAFTIKPISERERYYYILSDFPWPLYDRDYIAHTKMEQNKTTKVLTSSSVAAVNLLPILKNVIRMNLMQTKWIFTPLEKKEVSIEYTLLSDPGGTLPDWVVNLALDKGPFESLQKFKELLLEEKYKNAKVSYIQDF